MKHRKAKKFAHQPELRLVGKRDTQALAACFANQGPVLSPLLAPIQDARASIDALMSDTARAFVEQLLVVSAQEAAGPKHPGKRTGGMRWHGTQRGRIALAERRLTVPAATRPAYVRSRQSGFSSTATTAWPRATRATVPHPIARPDLENGVTAIEKGSHPRIVAVAREGRGVAAPFLRVPPAAAGQRLQRLARRARLAGYRPFRTIRV